MITSIAFYTMSNVPKSKIPSTLPALPPAIALPWSADIIQAHHGLSSTFGTSYRALNLDESDPIRLGHHLKQAETFMTSIVDALGTQTDNPLPIEYIETTREAVESLVNGLRDALSQATLAFVIILCVQISTDTTKVRGQVCHRSR